MSNTASKPLCGSSEAVGPAHKGVDVVGFQLFGGHHGDDLLGQHIEWITKLGDFLDRLDAYAPRRRPTR